MSAVGPALVIELPPAFDEHLGLGAAAEDHWLVVVRSLTTRALHLAVCAAPFYLALHIPLAFRTLSDRTNAGLPYSRISRDSVKITSCDPKLAPASIARHSRVYSDGRRRGVGG